jgi:hypothetical protein
VFHRLAAAKGEREDVRLARLTLAKDLLMRLSLVLFVALLGAIPAWAHPSFGATFEDYATANHRRGFRG